MAMYVIGLTGGIACGKSTVSKWLREKYQAPVLDADTMAIEMSAPRRPLWQNYVNRYGTERALLSDGTLNREAIGQIVFSDPKERAWVDQMAHPLIRAEAVRQLEGLRKEGACTAVLDVPLFFEAGWQDLADEVWVVYADEAAQIKRLMERDHLSARLARQRIAAQMPLAEKRRRADVVIDNTSDLEAMWAQVDAAWQAHLTAQNERGGTEGAQA
ncbi:MAG: dephospho-CoA kinase [Schwartzia sp. (in: firmicutes)]